jgi:serine/threonine-protein kinase RsbW
MDAKLRLQLQNRIQEIEPALGRVETLLAAAGLDEQAVFHLRLALDELITNSIMHGFPAGGEHLIDLEVSIRSKQVAVELSDDGVPFDPSRPTAPVLSGPAEERPIGGLGLHMVQQLIPMLNYRHARGRNLVSLEYPLPPTGSGTDSD